MKIELKKKVDRAIQLIQSASADSREPIEVSYSGGKDSDVILELTKMAGVKYRAIYKNTTIDPPGTIAHVKKNGVEVMQPKKNFFQLIAQKGFPSRKVRFCCSELKEYKIQDRTIIGVRKAESSARNKRYNEPTKCIGTKKKPVEAIYPILYWTNQDIANFIRERNIKCNPLYYDKQGYFHVEKRLGCMCCPLAYRKKRIAEFKQYPNMVKAYIKAGQQFIDTHPTAALTTRYSNIYDAFVRFLFYERDIDFKQNQNGIFGEPDNKKLLEEYFNIQL